MMTFALGSLPTEVLSAHIVPMLAIRDLVYMDSALVMSAASFWPDVVRQAPPVRFSDLSTISEVEWFLNRGYILEDIDLSTATPKLKDLILKHAPHVRSIRLQLPNHDIKINAQIFRSCNRIVIGGTISQPEIRAFVGQATNITALSLVTDAPDPIAILIATTSTQLQRITISCRALSTTHSSTLQAAGPRLVALDLNVLGLHSEQMCDVVSWCPNQELLWSTGSPWDSADTWLIALAQHCTKLRYLYIVSWTFTVTVLRAVLRSCRQLQQFMAHPTSRASDLLQVYTECDARVTYVDINRELVGDIALYKPFLSGLCSVGLSLRFLVSPNAIAAVSVMVNLEIVSLRSFDVASIEAEAVVAVVQVLRALLLHAPRINDLSLSATMVSHTEIAAAAAELISNRAMRWLVLDQEEPFPWLPLPDSLATALANSETGSLVFLVMDGFSLTDQQMVPIVRSHPRLETLELSGSPALTDVAITAIAAHCRHLTDLSVCRSHGITEAALVRLVQRCRRLTALTVSSRAMSQVTADLLHAEERIKPVHVYRVNH